MNEEIERVLRMVEEGKINSMEGTELIRLIKEGGGDESERDAAYSKRSVRIKVLSNDVPKVNLTVPLKLVRVLINIGKGITSAIPDAEKYVRDVDLDVIMEAIEQQVEGDIIDLETEEGDRVLISIE